MQFLVLLFLVCIIIRFESLSHHLHPGFFGGDFGPKGELWSTFSSFEHLTYGIIFATNMTNSFVVKPSNAHFDGSVSQSVHTVNLTFIFLLLKFASQDNFVYTVRNGVPSAPTEFSESKPVQITSQCTNANFCLYYSSPKLTYG
jgi:hypothetical protein